VVRLGCRSRRWVRSPADRQLISTANSIAGGTSHARGFIYLNEINLLKTLITYSVLRGLSPPPILSLQPPLCSPLRTRARAYAPSPAASRHIHLRLSPTHPQRTTAVLIKPRKTKRMKSNIHTAPSNTCECQRYLRDAIEGFENDPADSRFQDGYLAALSDMRDDLASMRRTRAARAAKRAKAAQRSANTRSRL
jgi:hypothetical protein